MYDGLSKRETVRCLTVVPGYGAGVRGGVLPYMGYIGYVPLCEGYGFHFALG